MPYKNIERQREYQRKWRANRRSQYLSGKTCVKCNSDKDLELHHRDPSQKISHSIWSWSEERRLTEIAKCDILCKECHDLEHGAYTHGTGHMYKTHGCRCATCRKWRSDKYYRVEKGKPYQN